MRPQFIFAILLTATLVVGAIVFLKQHSSTPVSVLPILAVSVALTPAPAPAPVVVKKTLTPEEKEAAIEAEKDKLSDWSMNRDRQSDSNILGDLVSSEKEIRMAAIDATKEFGDTNAISVLKSLAANTDDNEEVIAMLEAVGFLSVPPIDLNGPVSPKTPEQIQLDVQRNTAREARRQAKLQGKPPEQISQSPSQSAPEREIVRSEEHTSELQSPDHLIFRLLLEK